VCAQFKYKAALQQVNKTGFYNIAVTPGLSSYLKTDFSDLRIMDDSERQVPYVIDNDVLMECDTVYTRLNIIQNQLDDSGKNIVTIENMEKSSLNSIALLIRNASVSRSIDITGSDDMQHWYSIIENGIFEKRAVVDKDRFVEGIYFPLSSYKFIRLIIYDGRYAPLNIISAGVYAPSSRQFGKPLTFNPASRITQNDSSDGYSYLHVYDTLAFHKSLVEIVSFNQKFFLRGAVIVSDGRLLAGFRASSDTSGAFVPIFKSKDWLIKIYNGDNPPLKVVRVLTAQNARRIIAWLDSGKAYHLEMDDSLAAAPVYDLASFTDSIPKSINGLHYFNIQPIAVTVAAPATNFFKQSWLWPAIIIVLAVLVFFTVRLTKEVAAKR
jgi:hypothetical protein